MLIDHPGYASVHAWHFEDVWWTAVPFALRNHSGAAAAVSASRSRRGESKNATRPNVIELMGHEDPLPNRRTGRPLQPAADTSFAQALRRGREQLGMTLMQTAARAGVSYAFISELERGIRRPSERTMTRLCAALGLELGPDPDLE